MELERLEDLIIQMTTKPGGYHMFVGQIISVKMVLPLLLATPR
jgi:hypothetical protein